MFCIDSGASRVILKTEQYLAFQDHKRPKFSSKHVVLRQADGTTVKIDGVANMNIQVGTSKVQIPVLVAPVSDNLLGLSFLRKTCAQVDFDKLQLVIGDERIDCLTRDGTALYRRVVFFFFHRAWNQTQALSFIIKSCLSQIHKK